MGIDDITLTPELRASLYENVIVHTEISPVHIPYEGQNLKKILVAFDKNGKLTKEDRALLEKLLTACQLTFDDIALVNIHSTEFTIAKIVDHLHIKKAVMFGVPMLSFALPLEDSEEKVITSDHCAFLRTAPLGVLDKNVEKKKALWMALKVMFQL